MIIRFVYQREKPPYGAAFEFRALVLRSEVVHDVVCVGGYLLTCFQVA